jgi:hypothetical protein
MGNDTIVAGGQSTQGNNVTVDGGYNSDDALGTSSGAQVRTPLEAIQEFQVLTSMYDAEFGRASGAVVNAITKSGTNQFKGVVFAEGASNKLTAADYFVRTRNLTKPTAVRRDWGGVLGGPIVKNKAHFFVSLERQVDNPNRTSVFDTRPSLTFSAAEDRTDWNTLIRYDHQVSKNHSFAVRWLREWAPQWYTFGDRQTLESYQDETDLDQTAVATLTSVLGNARVNTFRVARTWEHWWHGNACFRAQGGTRTAPDSISAKRPRESGALPAAARQPRLPRAGQHRVAGPVGFQLPDRRHLFVVRPQQEGRPRHEVRLPLQLHRARACFSGQLERHVQVQHRPAVRRAQPRTYPERLTIRTGTFNEFIDNHTYEFFAQDKWRVSPQTTLSLGLRYDLEIIPLDESTNPLFKASRSRRSTRTTSGRGSASHTRWTPPASRSSAAGYGHLLQPDDSRRPRRHAGAGQVHRVERRPVPGQRGRPGPERGTLPDRSRTWSTGRP